MSEIAKIIRIGSSLGIVLSEQLRAMGLGEGDWLSVALTRDGIELAPCDAEFLEGLRAGLDFMRRYPDAMKKLAQ